MKTSKPKRISKKKQILTALLKDCEKKNNFDFEICLIIIKKNIWIY